MSRSEAMAQIIAADLDFPGGTFEGLHDALDGMDDAAFWAWWQKHRHRVAPEKTDQYTDGPAL